MQNGGQAALPAPGTFAAMPTPSDPSPTSVYAARGVSADKSEVHAAIAHLDKGLFPNAFCKILPDFATGDGDYCCLMHADTAGTKTSLAYLQWRETGDLDVWAGIAQDAIVMNVDDMACVGLTDRIALSSTIGRNKHLIPGEVIGRLIRATSEFADRMRGYGIDIVLAGGETADVGDIVRTADVGYTAYGRLRRDAVVDIRPRAGDVAVGFASYGQAVYEDGYSSGIGSNGLTGARHDVLANAYAERYPETFDPNTPADYVYAGPAELSDTLHVEGVGERTLGELLLSPTRTFLPLLHRLLGELGPHRLRGIVHNTGGGQSKAAKFLPEGLRLVKDRLLPVPPLFAYIDSVNAMSPHELYQVYNMGTRLECYLAEADAAAAVELARELGIDAQVIGRFEAGERGVEVHTDRGEVLHYPG